MSNISDIGLTDPLTKLIETVSSGIGKLYEPVHIKRMAKARATEIQLIGDSIIEADLLPVQYNNGAINIDGGD